MKRTFDSTPWIARMLCKSALWTTISIGSNRHASVVSLIVCLRIAGCAYKSVECFVNFCTILCPPFILSDKFSSFGSCVFVCTEGIKLGFYENLSVFYM
jgi:hypothetical protein